MAMLPPTSPGFMHVIPPAWYEVVGEHGCVETHNLEFTSVRAASPHRSRSTHPAGDAVSLLSCAASRA